MVTRKAVPKTGPLSRPCPRCTAQPGDTCHLPSGKTCPPHAARRNPQTRNANTGGRDLALTDTTRDHIAANLRLGAPLNMACQAAGIHPATAYRWLAQADSDAPEDAVFREFREAVTRARAEGGTLQLVRVNQAAQRHLRSRKPVMNTVTGDAVRDRAGEVVYEETWEADWRAAAFVLERSYARDFGRREILELSAGDGTELPSTPGAGAVPGLAGAGLERLVAQVDAFKARLELEAGEELGADGRPVIVDAELVD